MNVLGWIVLGGVAGWIASRLVGVEMAGCLTNICVGIGGALLGGSILALISGNDWLGGLDVLSLIAAVFGAAVLLSIARLLARET